MNADRIRDNDTSGTIELTGSQAELLTQLEKLLSFITSDQMIDM
jgi:hypothetical protein